MPWVTSTARTSMSGIVSPGGCALVERFRRRRADDDRAGSSGSVVRRLGDEVSRWSSSTLSSQRRRRGFSRRGRRGGVVTTRIGGDGLLAARAGGRDVEAGDQLVRPVRHRRDRQRHDELPSSATPPCELGADDDRVEVHADGAGLEPGTARRQLIAGCARLRSDGQRRRAAWAGPAVSAAAVTAGSTAREQEEHVVERSWPTPVLWSVPLRPL